LLPDNIDNVRLILDIDHLASTHNIKVQNLVLDENENDVAIGSPGRLYESAKMNFSVEAPYKVFMAFLEDLEASLRIIDAADLSFTSNQIDQYSYNVSIRTYWLR
jgi:hypothetical protein